jgi:CO/xanthine dehydrogenase Mo-binding subunit
MEQQIIGKDIIRKEAWTKVTGEALYNADFNSSGLLHGVLLTSTCAHGKIKSIDYTEASNMPGVKAIVTGEYNPKLTG